MGSFYLSAFVVHCGLTGTYRARKSWITAVGCSQRRFFWRHRVRAGTGGPAPDSGPGRGCRRRGEARRGLEILLATTLSSTEIVLGKLLARCIPGGDSVADLTGLLFAECERRRRSRAGRLAYLVTLTTGFLIAAIAILVSTLSDRPLRAIVATYVLVFAWLVLPFLPNPFGTGPGPPAISSRLGEAVAVFQQGVGMTNPLYIVDPSYFSGGTPWSLSRKLVVGLVWMMAAQVGVATLLIVVSAAILRPLARRAGSSASRFKLFSFVLSRRSLLPRRACGDRPILWKECHVARTMVLTRLVIVLAFLGIAISMGFAILSETAAAFSELRDHGYGSQAFHPCDELNLTCESRSSFCTSRSLSPWVCGRRRASPARLRRRPGDESRMRRRSMRRRS